MPPLGERTMTSFAMIHRLVFPLLLIALTAPRALSAQNGTDQRMTFALAGDAIISQRLSPFDEPEFLSMIDIIRGLMTGGYYEFHGKHYDIESIKICPVPTKPVPILIGGHSEPALRRAARLGDGWMHAGSEQADLEGMLGRLRELRKEYGRDKEPFEVHVISLDAYHLDGIRRLEDVGVTDVIVGFRDVYRAPDIPLQDKIDSVRAYADSVIAKA